VVPALKMMSSSATNFGLFFSLLGFESGLRLIFKSVFKSFLLDLEEDQRAQPPQGALKFPPVLDFLSGFIAGLSLFFWNTTAFATYTASLAGHALVSLKIAPFFRSLSPGKKDLITPILFGTSLSIQLYALQFENVAIRESSQEFLGALAGGQSVSHYQELSKKLSSMFGLPQRNPQDWA